jgi:hypothetical protein
MPYSINIKINKQKEMRNEMATKTTTGYTFDEMLAYGFYDYTLIASRPATLEESEYGCEDYEDCPCCSCGDDGVVVETYAGVRWSKSGKRMVERTYIKVYCITHKG